MRYPLLAFLPLFAASVLGQVAPGCTNLSGTVLSTLRRIVTLPDDGAMAVGRALMNGAPTMGLLLVRTDADGGIMWTRLFDGPLSNVGYDAMLLDEQTVVLCGMSSSVSGIGADNDLWVLAVDLNGDVLWNTLVPHAGNDYGYSLAPTGDGGCMVVGMLNDSNEHLGLVRLSASGELLWSRRLTTPSIGGRIVALHDGGFALVGMVYNGFNEMDQLVMRLDTAGEVLWQRCLYGPQTEEGTAIAEMADGSLLIGGGSYVSGTDPHDLTLTRLDSTGAFLWSTSIDNPDADLINDLLPRADGSCLAVGYSYSYGAEGALLLSITETSVTGRIYHDPSGPIFFQSMDGTADGGLWVCGEGNDGTGNSARLLRLDAAFDACPECATWSSITSTGSPLSVVTTAFVFEPVGQDTTFTPTFITDLIWVPHCEGGATGLEPVSDQQGAWILPGSGTVHLRSPHATASACTWSIVDLAGRSLATGTVPPNAQEVDTRFRGDGMHLLIIDRSDGAREVERFMRP